MQWDAQTLDAWTEVLEDADVVVHMTGKRVDCRPTKVNIDELISSRVEPVRLVGKAVAGLSSPPTAWVQLSSLAIFGDRGDTIIDESTTPPESGIRQQVEVCQLWEEAFRDSTEGIERTVLVRPAIGIGGDDDPASAQLKRLARWGLGGPVAGGDQWVSWIAAADLFAVLMRAITDEDYSGLVHATGPKPATHAEMMAAYRRLVGRSFGLPSPSGVVHIGAQLLGSDPQLALTGRRCIPTRLKNEGFEFTHYDIKDAVLALGDRI